LTTASEPYQAAVAELAERRRELCAAEDGLREIMVMREMSQPRPSFLLRRGAYDQPGEPVQPATPALLPPMPDDAPRNRLGLARWLTSPDNPLTARVHVNRLWQLVFGEGLVRTPEDFGVQGRHPTHPKLLDWLACRLIDSGWDTRAMLKLMVMSQTYRQDSRAGREAVERDPVNLWWGRAHVYRWPAETLRDQMLAVSGLLVRQTGGEPVKPYELEFSFQPSQPDQNAGLYRRSLYTLWKRNGPAPALMTLDAANREVCQVRRERTSSPLQSLVMLNGTQFVEAHRVTAERLWQIGLQPNGEMWNRLFRLLVSRPPTPREAELVEQLFQQQLHHFQNDDPDAARQLVGVGHSPVDPELDPARVAALATVVATIANFDECVVRR
jgi:hypothetical protein